MREIRTLRAKRRGLETELRQAGLRRRGAKAAAWPPDAYCHRASPRPYRVGRESGHYGVSSSLQLETQLSIQSISISTGLDPSFSKVPSYTNPSFDHSL